MHSFRWTAATGAEELVGDMPIALGINNGGTIAGAVVTTIGGEDYQLGALAPLGSSAVQLTAPLDDASNAYDVSDDSPCPIANSIALVHNLVCARRVSDQW